MTEFATYDIQLSGTGRGSRIIINDQDISDQAQALHVDSAYDQITTITVQTMANVHLVGQGIVIQKISSVEGLTDLLRSVSFKELDERAMNKAGWGVEGTLTEHVVEALLEMIGEAQT